MLTSGLREHEHAGIIPEMTADEWSEFVANVSKRGKIIKPLDILPDGRVIDGRHRLRAAMECGIEYVPVIVKEMDDAQVIEEMRDSGLRRNLTPGQRAAIVLKCEELVADLRAKAKGRQREAAERTNAKLGRGKSETVSPNLGEATPSGKSSKALAEKAGIGKSSMEYLQSVQRNAPDLFESVARGELTINKAYTEMKKRAEPSNVVQFPKKQRRKPNVNKSELARIHAELVEAAKLCEDIDERQSKFTPENLIRYRAKVDLPDYIGRLVSDYEAIEDVSEETFEAYSQQLFKALRATLFLVEAIEPDPVKSEMYSVMVGGTARYENRHYPRFGEKFRRKKRNSESGRKRFVNRRGSRSYAPSPKNCAQTPNGCRKYAPPPPGGPRLGNVLDHVEKRRKRTIFGVRAQQLSESFL